ncbi:MAG: acetate/propionate family kinase, partial [Candidatus Latescibacteria bacterium]|nr:acetate/propionate family kinase [Candidatus Latescibacterota bacterium]
MKVLVINCGSSSVKYQLIDTEGEYVLAKGIVERIGFEDAIFTHDGTMGKKCSETMAIKNHNTAMKYVLNALVGGETAVLENLSEIAAVGHRFVHGGIKFSESVIVNDLVMEDLKSILDIAPLHNPANLLGIEACLASMPDTPQVTVFDTAFHSNVPPKAHMYALPWKYYEKYGIRRYGFHGTSHYYVSNRAAEIMERPYKELKIITCHLGNGCSIDAVYGGHAVDTSMGFTPLEGLMMGTRTGDIDAAVPLYIMR